jgi:predicted Zn-dependent peptidase
MIIRMMRQINAVLLFFLVPVLLISTPEKDKYLLLDSGMPVYVQQRDHIPLVNMVFTINVGAKDEDEKTSGMVHILEHLIFLGETLDHTADELNREMRRHGVHFNAHTSHDVMTFEISLPSRFWKFGLDLLKEKTFRLEFSQQHLDKEKKIIFEEMAQHQDNPNTLGVFLSLQHLFAGHPYQDPIPGSASVIEQAAIEDILAFYKRFFAPGNCSLAVVGDIDVNKTAEYIEKIFRPLKNNQPLPKQDFKPAPPLGKKVKITRRLDITRAHLFLAFHAPPSGHDDQLAFSILDEILGKGINPLLRQKLVKRGRSLIYGLSTRYVPLQYGGAYIIQLTLNPKNLNQARRELTKFLAASWSFKYSIEDYPMNLRTSAFDYLETARGNIKFAHQQFQEQGMNAAALFSRHILFNKNKDSGKKQEPYMTRVEKIKSRDIQDIASHYLSGKKYVMISILPAKK